VHVLARLYADLTVYTPVLEWGQEGKSLQPSVLRGMLKILSAISSEKYFLIAASFHCPSFALIRVLTV
jgi:hypothetical protein